MKTKVNLVWATPNGEDLIAHMARVSAPSNQKVNADSARLIKYLIRNQHWSPFEMVNICLEVETTREVARQMLRHSSFRFQEFSQRYAEVQDFDVSEVRLQDVANRQNSIETDDTDLQDWWAAAQHGLLEDTKAVYTEALSRGVAKEVARKVLPEGLTMSKMYMNGTLRSWFHYVNIRCDAATQKEHREVALLCKNILKEIFPNIIQD